MIYEWDHRQMAEELTPRFPLPTPVTRFCTMGLSLLGEIQGLDHLRWSLYVLICVLTLDYIFPHQNFITPGHTYTSTMTDARSTDRIDNCTEF